MVSYIFPKRPADARRQAAKARRTLLTGRAAAVVIASLMVYTMSTVGVSLVFAGRVLASPSSQQVTRSHLLSPGYMREIADARRAVDKVTSPATIQRVPTTSAPKAVPVPTDSPIRTRTKTATTSTTLRRTSTISSSEATPVTTEAPTTTTAATPDTNSGFVERSGTTLTLNGKPFRFIGINIYMAASGGTPSSCGGELYPNVGVPLSHMPNGIVFRFWAFQNFFVSNGSFNWAALDQVLTIAADHNDRVIPVLANQGSYCDTAKDLSWYQRGYKSVVEPGDIVPYRQYVADIVTRYADNPTIAMWQLVNEGQGINSDGTCNEAAALRALLAFSDDVGGLVHSLDPHHLVSLGVIPGWNGSGTPDGQWCGAMNSDYETLMASPGNDICDYHDYGYPTNPMGIPFAPDLTTAIQMCHADGKPIMVAETGILADSPTILAPRAAEFRAKFSAQFQAGVVGELMWAWTVKPDYVVPDSDADYGISQGDPALALLGTF